jgi:hypothetical protein
MSKPPRIIRRISHNPSAKGGQLQAELFLSPQGLHNDSLGEEMCLGVDSSIIHILIINHKFTKHYIKKSISQGGQQHFVICSFKHYTLNKVYFNEL